MWMYYTGFIWKVMLMNLSDKAQVAFPSDMEANISSKSRIERHWLMLLEAAVCNCT